MTSLPQVTLEILAGEPLDKTVPVLDGVNVEVPASSIVSARAQVRVRPSSSEVLHEWTTSGSTPNALITSSGIRLLATAAETLAFQDAWPTYTPMWDLLVVDTAGVTSRLLAPSWVQLTPVLSR